MNRWQNSCVLENRNSDLLKKIILRLFEDGTNGSHGYNEQPYNALLNFNSVTKREYLNCPGEN